MTLTKKIFFFPTFLTLLAILFFSFFIGQHFALAVPILDTTNTNLGNPLPDLSPVPENIGEVDLNNPRTNGSQNQNSTNAAPSGDYQLLAPLPIGTGGGNTESIPTNNFASYAQGMITLIIGFSAVLAVLMFMIGGFTYMTGESIGGKAEGRKTMTNAIFGFVLLLGCWLILNTINPDLLNLNLDIQPVPTSAPSDGGGGGGGGGSGSNQTASQAANNTLAKELFGNAFSVNKGGCINPSQTNCTSLNVREQTRAGIINLQEGCSRGNVSCNLRISGGAEAGHESGQYSHANGYKMDISYKSEGAQEFRKFLGNQSVTNQNSGVQEIGSGMKPNTNYNFQNGGYNYVVRLEEDRPGNEHWDIAVVGTPR